MGEAVYYVASAWNRELQIGKYILEVEVGCSGLPPVKKKLLLENKGKGIDFESFAERFDLKETK